MYACVHLVVSLYLCVSVFYVVKSVCARACVCACLCVFRILCWYLYGEVEDAMSVLLIVYTNRSTSTVLGVVVVGVVCVMEMVN